MGNKILAVFAGAFVGLFLIGGLEQSVHLIYPTPASTDTDDPVMIAIAIRQMPAAAFLGLLSVYSVSSLIGGMVGALIGREKKQRLGLAVGAVIFAGGVANFWMIPHPLWFVICSLLVYLPMAYWGGTLGARFRRKNVESYEL